MPLAVLVVACVLPAGGLTIRYLTYDNGPHHQLPNVCTAVDDDALRQVVGDVQGQHTRDDSYAPSVRDSCQWGPGEPAPTVTIIADRDSRRWNSSSVDRASAHYELREGWVGGSSVDDSTLDGADEGVCGARLGDDVSTVKYRCAARDGNVIIAIQVIAPVDGVPTKQQLSDSAKTFAAGPGRTLLTDLVEDL